MGAGGKGSCSTGGGGGSGFVEMTTVNVEYMEELVVHVGGASDLLNISQSLHVGRSTNIIVAKDVKISTDQFPPKKISTKNARFTTFSNSRQNSVKSF